MDAGLSPARQARAQHRHELRTLAYVTLDQANGGIVRNLTHQGISAQVIAAVRPRQQLRVRFELKYPKLRVETHGEVVWATFSGQCGIRFLDLPATMKRQINEWIFGDLLEGISLHADATAPMFAPVPEADVEETALREISSAADAEQDAGLMLSATPLKVIELPMRREPPQPAIAHHSIPAVAPQTVQLDWLSQPLSGRSLAWTVNILMIIAALLLFALVFLAVTREAPQWPLAMAGGGAVCVAGLYWAFFRVFAGGSLGARLARLAGNYEDETDQSARFR